MQGAVIMYENSKRETYALRSKCSTNLIVLGVHEVRGGRAPCGPYGRSFHSRRILLRPCFARLLATLVGRPDACGAGASPSEAELLRCIPTDPEIFAFELTA